MIKELSGSDTYAEAYNLAVQDLLVSNLDERARKAGAGISPFAEGSEIRLAFLSREVVIRVFLSENRIEFRGPEDLSLPEKIVILHYLNGAADIPLTGELIGFEGIPDGRQYLVNFRGRTYIPLLKIFGSDPGQIMKAAVPLGGEKSEFGDFSVAIPALPHIRIVIILWRGDKELGPEAKIVFDRNIVNQLPVEDIIVLCNLIAIRLIESA